MEKIEVIIGTFHRPAFAAGLAARITELGAFSASEVQTEDIPTRIRQAEGPIVLILDAGFDEIDVRSLADYASLTLLRIGDEGRNVELQLRDVDAPRLGAVILAALRGTLRRVAALAFRVLRGGTPIGVRPA